jgi:hypothetical protein
MKTRSNNRTRSVRRTIINNNDCKDRCFQD